MDYVSGSHRISRARFRKLLRPYILLTIFVVPWIVLTVYPMLDSLWVSFVNWDGLSSQKFVGLKNYAELIRDPLWWHSIFITVRYSVIVVVVRTVIALGIAVVLARRPRIKGAHFFQSIIFWPYVLPVSIVTVLWSWTLNPQYGYFNELLSFLGIQSVNWFDYSHALTSIEVVKIWWWLGFSVLVFVAALLQIPKDYYEAAQVDGASPFRMFYRISLPLLTPQINFLLVTGIAIEMQIYPLPQIMTGGGPANATFVSLIDFYNTGFMNFRYGYASAMMIFLSIIIAAIALIPNWISRKADW